MNSHEKRYALSRIDEVTAQIVSSITYEHNKANRVAAVFLNNNQRLDLIRKGKVSLRSAKTLKDVPDYTLNFITTVFDFSAYEHGETIKDTDKLQARINKITEHATKVKDTIMLGDADLARKLLDGFAEKLLKL